MPHQSHNEDESRHSPDVIDRYIKMRQEEKESFFDVHDFESIIDHYLIFFDIVEASQAIDKGLSQHPSSSELMIRKAQLCAITNKTDEAMGIISSLELVEPFNMEVVSLKAEVLAERGDNNRAVNLLKGLLDRPHTADAFKVNVQIAQLYMKLEMYLDAIPHWQEVLKIDEEYVSAYTAIRQCYSKSDIAEEGIRYLTKRAELHPFSFPIWRELATCYIDSHRHEQAVEAFEYALVISEGEYFCLSGKGAALFELGRFNEALDTYMELVELNEDDEYVCSCIGECYEQMEKYISAEVYFLKALKHDSSYAQARLGYAIIQEHLGNADVALKQMETVVALEPENAEYWHIYAELQSRSSQFDKSQLSFQRAMQLDEENLEIMQSMLESLCEWEEYELALEKVQEAFEEYGDQPELYFSSMKAMLPLEMTEECLVLIELLRERHGLGADDMISALPELLQHPELSKSLESY